MQEYLKYLRLNLLNIDFVKLDSDWDFDNIISPFVRLYLITSGHAYVYHNDKKFDLKPGYMYLIPSYTYSRYKCELQHEQLYINFLEEIGSGLSIFSFNDFEYQIKSSKLDAYYFKRLLEINPNRSLVDDNPNKYDSFSSFLELKNNQMDSNSYMETQGLLKILTSRFIIENKNVPGKRARRDINKGLIYLLENLHENLTIERLAAYSNLSKDHFSRSFYEKFKMRPNLYIQSKRVERAQLLLHTTNDSLKDISEKVGFDNFSYFSKVFKKITGKTPAYYKKEQSQV